MSVCDFVMQKILCVIQCFVVVELCSRRVFFVSPWFLEPRAVTVCIVSFS